MEEIDDDFVVVSGGIRINEKMPDWRFGLMPHYEFPLDAEFLQVRNMNEAVYILELTMNLRDWLDHKPCIYIELYPVPSSIEDSQCLVDVSIGIMETSTLMPKDNRRPRPSGY